MNPELEKEWASMRRRMVKHLADKSSDLSSVSTVISSELYTDPERFKAEQQLLRTSPQFVALSQQLSEPGDTLLLDHTGPSIMVVRTASGELKAFLNRCPHRGAQLVSEPCNNKNFTCPYHAWRFDLEGALLKRPMGEAFDDNNSENHLTAVPVGEYGGLIFAICSPGEGSVDVKALLGSIAGLLKNMELERAALVCSEALAVDANWKLSMDANCEPYHVPVVHPQTISHMVIPYVYLQDSYGKHHRYSSPSRTFKDFPSIDEHDWPESNYSAVHFIYPNTVLTMTGDPKSLLNISSFYPGKSIGQSLALNRTYTPFGENGEKHTALAKMAHEYVMNVLRTEDFPMAKQVWDNFYALDQPARLQFGRNEHFLQNYHRDIAADINMPIDKS